MAGNPSGVGSDYSKVPPEASEFGGHAGMAEDWELAGHQLSVPEMARAERRIDPTDDGSASS